MDGGIFASLIVAPGGFRPETGPEMSTGMSSLSPFVADTSAETVPDSVPVSGNNSRDAMLAGLQAAMLEAPERLLEGGRLVDPHEVHTFAPGLYIRQVTNEKGSFVITMKHATEHPWFCLRGHLLVRNLETDELHEVHGGDRGVTLPGTQRAIYAVEETVFITVHPNPDDCQDLAELERRFIVRQELEGGMTAGELYRAKMALMLEGGGQ